MVGQALPCRFHKLLEMTSNSMSQDRSTIMIIMTLLTIVTVSFAGFHGLGAVSSKVNCQQFTSFSCLYSICLAILTMVILLTIFLLSYVTLNLNTAFTSELVYPLGRPPKS